MEIAVQKIAIVSFLILGLSHVFQPRAWARYFIRMRELGDLGNFLNAWMNLVAGGLIIGFHNVWTGIPVVLTVFGWLFVIKSALYLLVPVVGMKSLATIREDRTRMFRVAGAVLTAVAGLLLWNLIAA